MGHVNSAGYVVLNFMGIKVYGHHVAWMLQYGEVPSQMVDHKNGVRSDNRIINLRLVSPSQSICNTGPRSDSASGIKGVCFLKSKSSWQASIQINGTCINLGCFKSLDEAVICRKNAEAFYHGEFSRNRDGADGTWAPEMLLKKTMSNNKSGHNGVSFDTRSGKWCVRISVKGHYKQVGLFAELSEAVEARKRAEEENKEFTPLLRTSIPSVN
jgi:hypothetical protein